MKPENRIHRARRYLAGGAAALVGVGIAVPLSRAIAATASLPVVAQIVRAIEITVTHSLDFGLLSVTQNNTGIARIDPASGIMSVDGGGGLSFAGGIPKAGRLKLRGAPYPIYVSVLDNTMMLTNGLTSLTVEDFNFMTGDAGPRVTVTPAGPNNTAILAVGATLKARPGQLTGTYTGTNTIFANYQ